MKEPLGSPEDWLLVLVPLLAVGASCVALVTRKTRTPGSASLRWRDSGAVFLTPIVWPMGMLLFWSSRAWSRRDKVIGTLAIPGGYALAWATLGVRQIGSAAGPHPPAPLHSWAPQNVVHIVGGLVLIAALLLPSISMVFLASRVELSASKGGTTARSE